jgi:sec-independent protein translocase protein TatB
MFGIEWSEYVVIALVALIVIGPKELPGVLRAVGQWTVKVRRMAAEFQGQFQEALREAEMADLKKEADNLHSAAKGLASQFTDPMNFQGAAQDTTQEATKWEPKPEPVPESEPGAGKPGDASSPAGAHPEGANHAEANLAGASLTEAPSAPASAAPAHGAEAAAAAPPAGHPATEMAAAGAVPPPAAPEGSVAKGDGSVRP